MKRCPKCQRPIRLILGETDRHAVNYGAERFAVEAKATIAFATIDGRPGETRTTVYKEEPVWIRHRCRSAR